MFFVVPIFFGIFFAGLTGGFTFSTNSYNDVVDYNISEIVDPGWFTYWSVHAADGAQLSWEYSSSGGAIVFYLIKGYSEFIDFDNDNYFWYEDSCDSCIYDSGIYYATGNDEYYFIFYNRDLYGSTIVSATINVDQPTVYEGTSEPVFRLDFTGILTIVIVGFIIIGGIVVIVKFSRTSDRTGNYLQTAASLTGPSAGPSSGSPPSDPNRHLAARSAPVSSTATAAAVSKPAVSGKYCTKCGSAIKPGDTFCVGCGTRVSSTTPVTPITETKSASDGKCAYCGAILTGGDSCTSCGRLREKCEVCRRPIQFGDEIGRCMHCQRVFHYSHLKETVKVTGKCPVCREPLKEGDIDLEIIGKHK